MTFRKITIDDSVRYIPKSEQTKEKEIEPKKSCFSSSFLVNRTKTFHKT